MEPTDFYHLIAEIIESWILFETHAAQISTFLA
jgi:hypothetical protein